MSEKKAKKKAKRRPPKPGIRVWVTRDVGDNDIEIHAERPRRNNVRWGTYSYWFSNNGSEPVCRSVATRLLRGAMPYPKPGACIQCRLTIAKE
jgi:hypothetical protein